MRLSELIEGLSLKIHEGPGDVQVRDLTDDSRQVGTGSLFLARVGGECDGRQFIPDAVERGAVAVVTEDPTSARETVPTGLAVVGAPRVDQSLAGQLAERFFGQPSTKLRVIGVTGTNGKTTTAYLIQHLLSQAGVKCGLIGTVAIDTGDTTGGPAPAALTTPGAIDLSRYLADMAANGCQAAVAEVSSHALHQGRTAALRIHTGVFTNLTGDHLDYHKTMDEYAAAKALLFEQLGEDAWAVVNADDPFSDQMIANFAGGDARTLWCGVGGDDAETEAHRHICRAEVQRTAADHSKARFDGPWGSVEAKLPLVGRHNVANTLQAIAAAGTVTNLARGLRRSLQSVPLVPGRLEPVRAADMDGHCPTVLVDYAHTHDALHNVLTSLRPLTKGKLRVVFGCGGDRDAEKRPKMGAVAGKLGDVVVVTSDNPRTEQPDRIIDDILGGVPIEARSRVVVEPDRARAIADSIARAKPDDVVLLAGKGHEDYQIIGKTKFPFDDRRHAAEALRRWTDHASRCQTSV